MADNLYGETRSQGFNAIGSQRAIGLDELGGLLNSPMSPALYNLARRGLVYGIKHTVATAVAPLQVVPTTTAAFVLNNTDSGASAKNLIMLQCGIYLGSGTNGIGAAVFAGVTGGPLATQLTTDGTGFTKSQGLGAGQAASLAYGDVSKTVVAGWQHIGGFDANPAAAVPGASRVFDLNGAFIVRPTYAFMMHTVAGAGTSAAYCYSALWAEVRCTTDI